MVEASREYDPSSAILGLPGSELLRAAEAAGLEAVPEAFADRAYLADGRLVPRREPDSVLTDPAVVAARAVRLATDHEVVAIDGTVVAVRGPVDLHPRRHAGSGAARPGRSGRTRGRGRCHLSVHGVSGR